MTLTTKQPEDWKDLQNKTAEILRQCGFNVEVEKKAQAVRGQVELDVYAEEIVKGRKYSIICECKFWKSSIPQNVVHGFRTVVSDLGCNVGYIITTSGFQSGSVIATEYTNIELLTWEEFQAKFFESWYESYFSPQLAERLDPLMTYTEPLLPRWFHSMKDEEKASYHMLKEKYDSFGMLIMTFMPYLKIVSDMPIPSLPLIDGLKKNGHIVDNVPMDILTEVGYAELLEKCLIFGNNAIAEFRYFRNKYAEDDYE
jgi:restriction system protein